MLSNFLFSKPKNVGNAKCRPTIDRVSTNYWPTHRSSIDQLSTKYRWSVGEMSAKCRWTKSYIGRDTSGTTIGRVSTECRPTIDCYIDRLSTECRPTIDQVSTAISTDISVDITHSKQDPSTLSWLVAYAIYPSCMVLWCRHGLYLFSSGSVISFFFFFSFHFRFKCKWW